MKTFVLQWRANQNPYDNICVSTDAKEIFNHPIGFGEYVVQVWFNSKMRTTLPLSNFRDRYINNTI